MPTYEYRCRNPQCPLYNVVIPLHNNSLSMVCEQCHQVLKRKFSFTAPTTFEPHFNHAVGQYVTSNNHFKDALKRGAEDQFRQTGAEHNYVPIHPSEVTTTQEGMYETAKATHDRHSS